MIAKSLELSTTIWVISIIEMPTYAHAFDPTKTYARARVYVCARARARVPSHRPQSSPALESIAAKWLNIPSNSNPGQLVVLCDIDRDLLARYNLPMIEI